VREGKVRALGASNYTPARLTDALTIQKGAGFARFEALQPHYNLVERVDYETNLAPICAAEKLSCFPYFALARGFLTGKYRAGVTVDSPRSAGASAYLNERGLRVLGALDEVAAGHKTTLAAVALAWLRQQATVTSPIASARTVEQLNALLPMAALTLAADELAHLGAAAQ
jgi:aryl-alcohol dehydrogenase-like predicted oxidoreductase